jgi:hypothetical protein
VKDPLQAFEDLSAHPVPVNSGQVGPDNLNRDEVIPALQSHTVGLPLQMEIGCLQRRDSEYNDQQHCKTIEISSATPVECQRSVLVASFRESDQPFRALLGHLPNQRMIHIMVPVPQTGGGSSL